MPAAVNKLLVAEDDEDDILLFKEAVKTLNLSVTMYFAADGHQVLKILADGYMPDIIILDLTMPKLSGYDCLVQIRSQSCFNAIPVLICTTGTNYYMRTQCLENGADYFVVKSQLFSETLDLVNAVCRGSLSQRFTAWD